MSEWFPTKDGTERTSLGPKVPTVKETRACSGLCQLPVRSRHRSPSGGGRGCGSLMAGGAGGDGGNNDAISTCLDRRRRRRVLNGASGDTVDAVSSVRTNDRLLDQDVAEDGAYVFGQPRAPLDSGVVYPVCGS